MTFGNTCLRGFDKFGIVFRSLFAVVHLWSLQTLAMKADIYALFCLLNLCFQVEGVRDSNEKRHPMIKGRLISIHDEATEQVKKGVEVVRGKVISKPLSLKQLLKHLDHKVSVVS